MFDNSFDKCLPNVVTWNICQIVVTNFMETVHQVVARFVWKILFSKNCLVLNILCKYFKGIAARISQKPTDILHLHYPKVFIKHLTNEDPNYF